MMRPCYPVGCAAGSQVRGIAASPGDYAWNVNFNNGNANWNDQDNNGFVRACRAGECQDSVSLRTLYAAWREARRGKRPSANQLDFDTHWLDALLRRSPAAGEVIYRCSPEERAAVPAYKRLENAAPGCGIAIGNLSSQFFANVYLNELDQFVKHELKTQHYIRYVDDFVLVHESRAQLMAWRESIERFLRDRLRLTLKPEQRLEQLASGIDFLGYIVFPRHTLVRRRVVVHAREKLDAWRLRHARGHRITASRSELEELRSICASYAGHFSHANTWRLRATFRRRYHWIRSALRNLKCL